MPARQFNAEDIARLEALAQRPAAELRALGANQRRELDEFLDWREEQADAAERQAAAEAAAAEQQALTTALTVPLAALDQDAQREAIVRLARASLIEDRAGRNEVRALARRQRRFHVVAAVFAIVLVALGVATVLSVANNLSGQLAKIQQATGQLVTPTSFDCRNASCKELAEAEGGSLVGVCLPVLATDPPEKAPPAPTTRVRRLPTTPPPPIEEH